MRWQAGSDPIQTAPTVENGPAMLVFAGDASETLRIFLAPAWGIWVAFLLSPAPSRTASTGIT